MIVLGIESTAHTLGAGVVENGKILSDIRDVYKPLPGRGIHPMEAKEHHEKVWKDVIETCLCSVGISIKEIDAVAYSKGPGLPPCLKIGVKAVKELKRPAIGINHCVAHIEIGKYATGAKDPIIVFISGGNTQIIGFSRKRYRIFGETIDISIGNAIDMIARYLELSFPGGPEVENLAKNGKYIELPYSVKGMDLSFSGLVTACKQLKKERKEDICYSFQETAFAMLTEVTERAVAHTEKNEILLVGGVAANKRLQEMMKIMSMERGTKLFVVPQKWAGDNGAMIGYTGWLALSHGQKTEKEPDFIQKWRTDEVDIIWMDFQPGFC